MSPPEAGKPRGVDRARARMPGTDGDIRRYTQTVALPLLEIVRATADIQ
jgi:hypothetical protein